MKTNGERKPIRVVAGNVSVPIYRMDDGRFLVSYTLQGKPRQHRYHKEAKARQKAAEAAEKIGQGRNHAEDLAARHGMPLHAIVEEWAALKGRVSEKMQWPSAKVVSAIVAAKGDQQLSAKYARMLRRDWERYVEALPHPLKDHSIEEIEAYLRELAVSSRRRNNVRDAIVTLHAEAQERGYLPEGTTAASKVKRVFLPHTVPTTYSVAEMQALLDAVAIEWLPWIALGAFAGLRTEEICLEHATAGGEVRRLCWEDIKWSKRVIDLPAFIAKRHKQNKRRLVPMSANLIQILKPWRHARGPICLKRKYSNESDRLGAMGLWKANALRHSFGSYWQAVHKDMGELADIMGNSVEKIKSNYHDAKYRHEGLAYFRLVRREPANVVRMVA